MKLPPVLHLRQDDTHHLVQYALDEQRSLSRVADDAADLSSIIELERLTGHRVLGESGLLPGVSIHELAFAITYAHIVDAAFTDAHPTGSRFNRQNAVQVMLPFGWKLRKPKWPIIEPKSSGDQLASS